MLDKAFVEIDGELFYRTGDIGELQTKVWLFCRCVAAAAAVVFVVVVVVFVVVIDYYLLIARWPAPPHYLRPF
jgi:hypothetical protein